MPETGKPARSPLLLRNYYDVLYLGDIEKKINLKTYNN